MTKSQSNKFSMLEAVAALLKAGLGKLGVLPIMVTLYNELLALIAQIKATDQEFKTLHAGKTNAKDDAKEELIDVLLMLANALFVFGQRSRNEELTALSRVSKTSLNRMRENDLAIKAATIKDALTANLSLLDQYMVTADKITLLGESLSAFQSAADTKDTGFANRVAAREKLENLFEEAENLLTGQIDGMMEHFKNSDPDFYNAYFAARVIKNLGNRKEVKEPETPANPS